MIAIVALLVAVAFTPVVQTWFVERALAGHSGLQATVGSVSAGLSAVHVEDLRLEFDGAVLTLPALETGLPLKTALWDRKVLVGSLVAKGWTLDLTRRPAGAKEAVRRPNSTTLAGDGTAPAHPVAAPTQQVASTFRGILRAWALPCDVSLNGVDLEGDVLIATPSGKDPARFHVILKGGGLAAGHAGDFAFDVTGTVADSKVPLNTVAVHGRLVVGMESPRTFNHIEFKGSLSSADGTLPEDLGLSAGVAATGRASEESYTLDLSRGSRHLATVSANFSNEARQFAGNWKLDLRDSDWARFYPGRSLPTIAANGEGNFDTDPAFARAHATGSLNIAASHLGFFAPPLDNLGAVTVGAGFDLAYAGQSIRVDRLTVSLASTHPVAIAKSVQVFTFDEKTGELKMADPRAAWIEGSLQGFPLAWLAGLVDGLTFAGGDATGNFAVTTANGEFAVRSKTPLVATGVTVQRGSRVIGQGLDLSLSLLADHTSHGWTVQAAPLAVGSAGQRIATIEAKASPLADAGRRTAIAGAWSADLEVLAAHPAIPGIGSIKGRSASGDFSASVGRSTDVKGTINVIGHDPSHSLTASVRAFVDPYGGIEFHVPVRIVIGSNASDFSADGTWINDKAGRRVDAELTAVKATLEHLGPIAAAFSFAGASPTAAKVRDQHPFWGDLVGQVKCDFYQLRVGDHDLNEVAGKFDIDHASLRLQGGRGAVAAQIPAKGDRSRSRPTKEAPRSLVTAEGWISFDATAEFPYRVKATATIDAVDATRLFPAPQPERDPLVEGRFSVADTFTSNGINLQDLIGRRQEEFRLTSNSGIIRLLKTSVAESIPEAPSHVSDALVNVGSVVGSLIGLRPNSIGSGKNPVSKAAEAVLNFTYQIAEIGYDQITVTAIRGADRTIRLSEITMNAPNERLTGSGEIGYVEGRSIRAQPLSVDVRFGASGKIAEFLSTAGLLSAEKDDQGFKMIHQPIHFGGTLEHIDESQWHDLLVKAATQTPDRGKKGG